MRVLITGATGFIGRALCGHLCSDYEVIALSRDARRAAESLSAPAKILEWDARTLGTWAGELKGDYSIIHLAGENAASSRWNKAKKNRILHSRTDSLEVILRAVNQAPDKPKAIILSSAIGYYGPCGDEELDETSGPGESFLADICRRIEAFEEKIRTLGARCVIIRTGVVLGSSGGALPKFIRPFRFYLGGWPGSGRQWLSWLSLQDEVKAIRFLMENEHLSGAFNLTAPCPVTMKEFCITLGRLLKSPAWMPVPPAVMHLFFGKMADQMLLVGQRVLPKRLMDAHFEFDYPDLDSCLGHILRRK